MVLDDGRPVGVLTRQDLLEQVTPVVGDYGR